MNQAPQADARIAIPTIPGPQDAKTCAWCGGERKGRRKRFCADECSKAWWESEHPRINRSEHGPRQGTLKALILGYLSDGLWHTEQQIADGIHAFAHSVGARLSELRRAGQPIEVDPRRIRRYRLALPQVTATEASFNLEGE